MFLFIHAVFVLQSKNRHFTRGAKQWTILGTTIVTFQMEVANSENDIVSGNGHRIKTPSSKLMILVSSCWEKNYMCHNTHNFVILSLVFLKLLIVDVAFFLGHPVSVPGQMLCTPCVLIHSGGIKRLNKDSQ